MSQFVEKLRAHAETEFGKEDTVAVENWLNYWASTVERNERIVSFFRSKSLASQLPIIELVAMKDQHIRLASTKLVDVS